jgi:hypothetical protein
MRIFIYNQCNAAPGECGENNAKAKHSGYAFEVKMKKYERLPCNSIKSHRDIMVYRLIVIYGHLDLKNVTI